MVIAVIMVIAVDVMVITCYNGDNRCSNGDNKLFYWG